LWQVLPLEVESPVEAALHQRGLGVLERAGVDDVDDRNGDGGPLVGGHDGEQGLQPLHVHLTVAVQEHQNLGRSSSFTFFCQEGFTFFFWEQTVLFKRKHIILFQTVRFN